MVKRDQCPGQIKMAMFNFLWSSSSQISVYLKNTQKKLVKNINLILFRLPHLDMPATLVQKSRDRGEHVPSLCI